MRIADTLINEGLSLLKLDEQEILIRLGNELYSWERQESTQTLASSISAIELKKRAQEYLDSKKRILKKAVCQDWKDKKTEDLADAGKLLTALIGIITQSLNLTPSYVNIAMIIAVIVIKHGLDRFCKE
jgi:hypothetical protein